MDKQLDQWQGRRVLVMGLGRFGGGVGVTRYLAERGAEVTVTDQAEANTLKASLEKIANLPVKCHIGGHDESDFIRNEVIVVNPGVKKDSPWLKVATEQGAALTSEMNIFFTNCPAQIIGITGSNGKSTTTAMIGHILGKHFTTWLGGNIGRDNLLEKIDQIRPDHKVVLELSSFQLYDLQELRKSPHLAVLTNVAPNHLDWHGTMEAYVQAKQNIVRFQDRENAAVLNALDPELVTWQELTPGKVVFYPREGWEKLQLPVPGRHNQLNASAALAAAELEGIDFQQGLCDLQDYLPLPHRLELVREINGIRFYNDSIATTPESTIAAIASFEQLKALIMGGYDKKIDFAGLADEVVKRVDVAVLLGQTRDILEKEIIRKKREQQKNSPEIIRVENLEQAVHAAYRMIAERTDAKGVRNGAVLLSPACASYDMFQNFQQRGDMFRELVKTL